MKTKSSLHTLFALFALAAIVAVLTPNAEAGNRRPNNPPPVTTSGTAPVVSLP